MPTSYTANIPPIMEIIERIKPSSVLDVGPGYGKYGFLMRERLDNFERKMIIDCIDPFDDYLDRSKAWQNIYDSRYKGIFPDRTHVWMQNEFWYPLEWSGRWGAREYDLILMIDVLEHYTQDDGIKALQVALRLAPKVLICTPIGYEQGEVFGNPYEVHRSEWRQYTLDGVAVELGARAKFYGAGTHDSVLCTMTRVNQQDGF